MLLLLAGVSCTEEIVPEPYTYTKVFTGENKKTWAVKFVEETLNGEIIDTFSIACSDDDQYTFYNNVERTFEVETGNQKCSDPEEADRIEDTWSYTIGSTSLTMILPFLTPDYSLPFIVREVDKTTMEAEIFFDNNTASYRIHFSAVDED